MDLKGSLVDTHVKIYPTKTLLDFLQSIQTKGNTPINILKLIKGKDYDEKPKEDKEIKPILLTDKDIETLNVIKQAMKKDDVEETASVVDNIKDTSDSDSPKEEKSKSNSCKETSDDDHDESKNTENGKTNEPYLTTMDIDWLYTYLQNLKSNGEKNVPFLHVLLDGAQIEMPENEMIKRNPVLEARCVKLRAQQEAREYRKMTKTVDNVRMRFPEDSISYQLKQVNRQLIAIGQFIISIFAGFLFGFKGIEWMVGDLDFGFKLLLGVMCALVIALAEIYFLAKKLNEELNVPETIQLGGPPKFANEPPYMRKVPKEAIEKEHQD